MEIVNVIAVSTRKDQGWIRCAPIAGNGIWGDIGMHFDKSRFANIFTGSGIYQIDYVNKAGLGGTDLVVKNATQVISFTEVADEFLEENDNEKML